MKRIVVAAVAVVVAVCGLAVERLNWQTASEAQYRAVLEEMLAQTDNAQIGAIARDTAFWNIAYRSDLSELRFEADAALADKGYYGFWDRCQTWPKLSQLNTRRYAAEVHVPRLLALSKKYTCDANAGALHGAGCQPDEMAVCLGECASNFSNAIFCCHRAVDAWKNVIQKAAVKGIKRKLREQGRSFVTKNGISPVEVYLTRLNTALNAPRFAGLNEWLADLGYVERIDLSSLPSEKEVSTLKEAVLFGDSPFNASTKNLLYVCLGVDGYNAFVKEYNGD
jgi:hypothetical protein